MQIKKGNIKKQMASCSVDKRAGIKAGIDILERSRIGNAINKYGDRFVNKIFTKREIKSFPAEKELYYSIGFSLKEAFWKTLPEQFQKKTYFDDIEIIWKNKKPEILLNGKQTRSLNVSFFYDRKIVLCYVIRSTGEKY